MRRHLPVIFPIIAALIISFPFFQSGYFASDDGEWAVIRLAEMKRELRDGQFPARWSDTLNHGYGYPLFHFAYPLPYYLGAAISATGLGLVTTIKLLFVASVMLSGVGMYLLARELGGQWAGIITSVLYVAAPFRLVDLYQRGSLGESLAFAVFPFLCYAGVQYILQPTAVRMTVCAVMLATMIMTHNALAFLFLPIWFLFLLIIIRSYAEHVVRYMVRHILPMLLFGLGLSAFFWFPALWDKQYIILSEQRLANPADHMVTIYDYLSAPWYASGKREFALGWISLAAFLASIVSYIFSGAIERKKYQTLSVFLGVGFLGCLFLTTRDTLYLWEHTVLSVVDFPWRLLPVLVFLLSLGSMFLAIHRYTRMLGVLLAGGAVVWAVIIGVPLERIDQPDSYYETNDDTTTSANEFMPLWVRERPGTRPADKVMVVAGQARITDVSFSSRRVSFRVAAPSPAVIRINTIYFPGWQFAIEDIPVAVNYQNSQGVMEINVTNGSHEVVGTFTEPIYRRVVNILSGASLIGILLLWVRATIRHFRPRKSVKHLTKEEEDIMRYAW